MRTVLTDEQLDEVLKKLFALHQGKENAIKRWDLVTKIFGPGADLPRTDANGYDRQIRDSVERLRNHGVLILNLNDGRGRYMAANEAEYLEFRNVYVKQVKSIAAVLRTMDKQAVRVYPNILQPALFDLDSLTNILE
jgi:hypothetical protein